MDKDKAKILQILQPFVTGLVCEFIPDGKKAKVSLPVLALALVEYESGRRAVEPLVAYGKGAELKRPGEICSSTVAIHEQNLWKHRFYNKGLTPTTS